MNMLRWIGTVIVPLPAAVLLSTFIRIFGMSLVEPDDCWPEIVSMFAFGVLLALLPGLIAPKFKTRVSYSSAVIYFLIGIVLIACGRTGFLAALPCFIGLAGGAFYFDVELSKKFGEH